MNVAIVGAGIAGFACAGLLTENGHRVRLFDKGRGAGGRMASRRIETVCGIASLDHGAQYFTARSDEFIAQVAQWRAAGLVACWPEAGEEAWIGLPAMNAVVKHMAAAMDVRFAAQVTGLEKGPDGWSVREASMRHGPFDAVILAMPAEQTAALVSLHDFAMARIALRARSQPCWTGMFVFRERLNASDAPIRDRGAISWAVRNVAKPGRTGPESWVVQAQPDWSRERLEEPAQEIAGLLFAELEAALGSTLCAPLSATAHRWRFAMSSGTGDEALWCPEKALGACGDWLIAPRVESAWLSGRALARKMLATRPHAHCNASAMQASS